MFKVGTGTILQVGKESKYPTADRFEAAVMTDLINLTSESIKVSVEKGDEGSLLASKTAQTRDLLGINIDGSVSFILKPEFAGRIIQAAMGGKDTVSSASPEAEGYHKHSIVLCGPNDVLPSLTFTINRKTGDKAYNGCTLGSLSIDAAAGDYVKGSFDLKGFQEGAGTMAELTPDTTPSYRCTEATFTFAGETKCITNASFKLDNALEDAPKTYCSKKWKGQPMHGLRNATINFDIPYDETIDALKDTYLTEEATAKVVLKFTSKDTKDYVEITMPHVSINDVTANVGGAGIISASIAGEALEMNGEEPVTIVIQDKESGAYSD